MKQIEVDTWVSGCKVRAFPWIDGENYYVNIQGFQPGGAVSRPAWEKTVFIAGNDDGYIVLQNYLHTLVEHVSRMDVAAGSKCVLNVELSPLQRKMAGFAPLDEKIAEAEAAAGAGGCHGRIVESPEATM